MIPFVIYLRWIGVSDTTNRLGYERVYTRCLRVVLEDLGQLSPPGSKPLSWVLAVKTQFLASDEPPSENEGRNVLIW